MRRIWSAGSVAALALSVTGILTSHAAALDGLPGQGLQCSKSGPDVIATYSTPQAVSASGGLQCVTPGANAPGQFGPPETGTIGGEHNPTSGPCDLRFDLPVDFRFAGRAEYRVEAPPSTIVGQSVSVDPSNPGIVDFGWSGTFIPYGISAADYEHAGTMNAFEPWDFIGQWTAQGLCKGTQGINTGWVEDCGPGPVNTVTADAVCVHWRPPGAPVVGGPIGIGGLPIDLNAFLRGQFKGGTISSLPNNPNPGLINVGTCFSITGMAIQGGGNPLGQQTWEQIVQGPEIAGTDGRHIYYTLVIRVSYRGTDWNWGDGTGATERGRRQRQRRQRAVLPLRTVCWKHTLTGTTVQARGST
jgi:hypothetical protein